MYLQYFKSIISYGSLAGFLALTCDLPLLATLYTPVSCYQYITLYTHSQRQHMMRQEMKQATKQQEEQARNKEIEQEREQIEKDKLNKQQLTRDRPIMPA